MRAGVGVADARKQKVASTTCARVRSIRRPNGSAGKLRTAPHANSDAARPLPRLTTHSAGAIATGVTPSHTLVQELQLRASISAVRQLQLQVLRGVRFRASFVPTRRGNYGGYAAVVVAVDGVSPAPATPTYDTNNVGRRFSEPASGRATQLQIPK